MEKLSSEQSETSDRVLEFDLSAELRHGIAVSNLAYALSKELGLPHEQCYDLAIAGMLHDIGKLKLRSYINGQESNPMVIEELKYVRMHSTPPSAKLCSEQEDRARPYAQQGTDCHELCAYLVEKSLGKDVKNPTENLEYYDQEMQDCAESYRDFVTEQIEAAKQHCPDPQVMIE